MLAELIADIDVRHRQRWPGRRIGPASRLRLLAGSPGLWVLAMHRLAFRWRGRRLARLLLAPLKWLVMVRTKCEIGNGAHMEPGICLSDGGHIVFGARHAGRGTRIGTRVTVGRRLSDAAHPTLGRDVCIGDDCVVYGPIHVGDGAILLPGTVLTKSVPAGAVVEGNPGRIVTAARRKAAAVA